MPRKSKDQRRAAKTSRIATRGAKRAANKEVRKETRTERLAARKGISNSQAKRLQANRKTRLKEFTSGGTENITTGRLRFSSDPSGESTPASATGAADATKNDAAKAFAPGSISANDRLGSLQDPVLGRGGKAYNSPGAGGVGSVEIGDVEIDGAGYSDKTLSDSGYKRSRGGGAYGS